MTYSEKLKDPRWQAKRLLVMDRDDFSCCDCHARDRTLHVHHCHYSKGNPWDTPERFLLTLCENCHDKRGSDEQRAKEALASVMARMFPEDVRALADALEAAAESNDFWRRFTPQVSAAEAGDRAK